MMETQEGIPIFGFLDETFGSDKVIAACCYGQARIVGDIGYDAAPASAPTIEFSMDGLNWIRSREATADPAGVGVTLYTWDETVGSWKFVRITLPAGTASGNGRMLPKVQA